MPEYLVEVTHTLVGRVKVEADSPEAAEEQLKEKMAHGWAPYNAGTRSTVETLVEL